MDKNLEHVQNIVKDMADFASGNYFIYDGDLFPINESDFCKKEGCTIQQENVCGDIHTFYVMPDGTMLFEGDIEIATIGDYFNNVYDIEYIVGSDNIGSTKWYKACRVLVAAGGPTIYVDTLDQEVQLSWWGERAEAYIPDDLCEQIDEFFEMLYNC